MIASTRQWVVMFGGAEREATIERMLSEGIHVHVIIIPARRNARLERSVERLKALSCDFLEVDKLGLADTLKPLAGKALLSIGFPYLIPGELLESFVLALNIHPTLLPRYRGPTTGAYILLNNERESGSTVHYMTNRMDRGDIVLQSIVTLNPFDTIRSLQRKVYASEPQLLMDSLAALDIGVPAHPQDESQASEFPKKRTPADSEIDPSRPLTELFNQIRACDPDDYPAFFFHMGEKVCIRLWRSEKRADAVDEI